MSELGFWNQAKANPDRVALIDVDGTKIRSGELLARSNQLVHGLRALGLERGDCITTVLPNCTAMIELYLAAAQGGWYLTPINHHLTGPEIAYIVKDSDAKVFIGHQRFEAACRAAADEIQFPSSHRFAIGNVAGFRPYAELTAGQPTSTPENRSAGQVMNYTSGTTGRPKGVRRKLSDFEPDMVFAMYAMFLAMFGIQSENDNVHPAVPHRRVDVYRLVPAHGPRRRIDG
jgi:long-chain acyl-CoA synthetase